MSTYFNSLDYVAQKRYLSKLKIGDNTLQDPYAIEESLWSEDMRNWPDLQFGDIYSYLINTEGCYTKERLKAYKSLEAYNYFYNGYVRTVYFHLSEKYGIHKAKVNPSQKAAVNCHEPWVILCMETGSVITGHCTCMAGLGEVCSHVAALLFKIEAACRLGYTKPSVTSVQCQWNRDFRTGVTPAEISDVEFVKPKYTQTKLPEEQDCEDEPSNTIASKAFKEAEVPKIKADKLYDALYKIVPEACLFTIVQIPENHDKECSGPATASCDSLQLTDNSLSAVPLSSIHSPLIDSTETVLPSSVDPPPLADSPSLVDLPLSSNPPSSNDPSPSINPQSSINSPSSDRGNLPKSLPDFITDNYKQCDQNILGKAKHLFNSLHLQEEECAAVERATRSQRESDIWYQQRQGRLTASSFHNILTMKKQINPKVLIDRLLRIEDLSHIPAIKWGIDKEDVARQAYIKEMSSHQNFTCKKAGLVINPLYPHLGASPDGFISCICCGDGLVEIKCPFSIKDGDPNILGNKLTFLNEHGLSMSHKYYTQVQGQLLVTGKSYCDFVVWTPKGQLIQRLHIDVNFTEKLLRKLNSFYVEQFLPELIKSLELPGNLPSSDHSTEELFCLCQQKEYGRMIMCDNPHCKYVWFHYSCVGIQRATRGLWYCPDCADKIHIDK